MEGILASVKEAIRAIHSPSSSNEQRREAAKFCEEFQTSCLEGFSVSIVLSASSEPDELRHFGIQTFTRIVSSSWNSLDAERKQLLKQTSINLIQSGSKGVLEETLAVKERIVSLMVEMAKRDWPQEWPSLHEDLLRVASSSPASLELVLMSIRSLAELVVKSTSSIPSRILPERRRAEIRAGLETAMPPLLQLIGTTLSSNLSSISSRVSLVLSKACLAALVALADWASFPMLFGAHIPAGLAAILPSPDLFIAAADALTRICARKTPHARENVTGFAEEMLSVWKATINVGSALMCSQAFEQKTLMMTVAMSLLQSLIKHHLAILVEASEEDRVALSGALLKLLGDLLSYDEFEVGQVAVVAWMSLIRDSRVPTNPAAKVLPPDLAQRQRLIVELLRVCSNRFIADKPAEVVGKDDSDERTRLYNRYRSWIVDFIRVLTTEDPSLCIRMASERSIVALQTPATDNLNDAGYATVHSRGYIELQSSTTLLLHIRDVDVVKRTLTGEIDHPDILAAAEAALLAFVNASVDDALYVSRQAITLSMFPDLLVRRQNALSSVLEKLLNLVSFTPSRTGGHVQEDIIAAQRRACYSLIALAKNKALAAILINWQDALLARISEVGTHSPMLAEFMVLINNEAPLMATRMSFLDSVLSPALTLLRSPEMSAIIATPASISILFGCTSATSAIDQTIAERNHDSLKRLRQLLHTCASVFRRFEARDCEQLAAAIGSAVASVLPSVVLMIQNLHELLCDSNPNAVFASYAPASLSQANPALYALRNRVTSLRELVYSLWALTTRFTIAMQTVDPSMLLKALLPPLSSMPSCHAALLISKAWKPFLDTADAEQWQRLLIPTVPRLLDMVEKVLADRWSRVMAASSQPAEDGADTEREVFEDNSLREFTRHFLVMLHCVLVSPQWIPFAERSNETAPAPGESKQDKLCHLFVSDASLAMPLLRWLLRCILVPDSASQRKALALWSCIVPKAIEHEAMHPILGDLIVACLHSLESASPIAAAFSPVDSDTAGVICEVYTLLGRRSPLPRSIMLRLPGVTLHELEELDVLLASNESDRRHRHNFRTFLCEHLLQRDRDASSAVLDLPKPLSLPQRSTNDDADGSDYLAHIFST